MSVPTDTVRITMEFLRDGDTNPYDVTFGLDPTGGSGTLGAILTDVVDAWNDGGSLKALTPANVSLSRVRGQYGGPGPDVIAELAVGEAGGDSSGALQAPNVSVVIKKITGFAGQKFRGRLYQPWVKEAQVDDAGMIAAGTVTLYTLAWEGFRAAMIGKANIDAMLLLHQDNTSTVVTNLICRPKVGSQRRRLHL